MLRELKHLSEVNQVFIRWAELTALPPADGCARDTQQVADVFGRKRTA
jgi:hypothetical protein